MRWPTFQSLKMLTILACLSLLLTSLGACAGLNQKELVAIAPSLPPLPADVKTCLKNHVNLPEGDWNVNMVGRIIAQYQGREDELESCLIVNDKFYQDLRRGLARKGKSGWLSKR
jgi:hypothetical protein